MAYAIHGVELGTMVYPKNSDGTPAGPPYDDGAPAATQPAAGGGGSVISQLTSDVTSGLLNSGAGFLQNILHPTVKPVAAPPPSPLVTYAIPMVVLGGLGLLAVMKMKKKA
jgi:hypothetical protein